MKRPLAALLSALAFTAIAQTDITVTAPPIEDRVSPAGSQAARFFESTPGLAIQSQGGRSAQLDLSVQGSSFSGAGLSLNGITFQNAQTEHFNAELPISPSLLNKPAALTGINELYQTYGHLMGTVSTATRTGTPLGSIEAGAGTDKTLFFHTTVPFGNPDGSGIQGAIFLSREEADELSYDDNYLESTRGGATISSDLGDISLNLLVGISAREFGARGFYGVTPNWNAIEKIDDQLILLSASSDSGGNTWRASAAWRRTEDNYTLLWTLPGTYQNVHTTDFTAVNIDGASTLRENFKLNWRASASSDKIESDNLGDHSREYGSILIAPALCLGKTTFHVGVNQLLDSDEDSEAMPVASIEWDAAKNTTAFCSYSETRRLPSYTELNYESPGSLGNEGLDPEYSKNLEAGVSAALKDGAPTFSLTAFRHKTDNTIDWVKSDEATARWQATNIGEVETVGIQGDLTARWRSLNLYLSYIYLHRNFDEDYYAGRYIINYPEHTIVANLTLKATEALRFFINHELRTQHDAPFRDELDNSQVMADAGFSITPSQLKGARINVVCENVWNDDFEVFPGQPPASTRYNVSLQWFWQ